MSGARDRSAPTLEDIRGTGERIASYIMRTPVTEWPSGRLSARLGAETRVWAKLELLQRTGTFKARGAIANVLDLSKEQLARGVTTVSGGNHAIAVAYAARIAGATAKVVMMRTANPARVAAARSLGAEVLVAKDATTGFSMAEQIQREEGRSYIHGFDGRTVTCATATIAQELFAQIDSPEVVIVPIGGGGLCSGIVAYTKLFNPDCAVYGVQPVGAGAMIKSLAAGRAQGTEEVNTIADSLASPKVGPYSFDLLNRFLDGVAKVDDLELTAAIALIFEELKMAVEPAAAAATAALLGPLRDIARGKRVALIVCGSNIDTDTYTAHLRQGARALKDIESGQRDSLPIARRVGSQWRIPTALLS